MLSSLSEAFLARNRGLLLADEAILFCRVIHLLRVACKTTPSWMPNPILPTFFMPFGNAWPAVLAAVRKDLNSFLPKHLGLIVGLLNDWAISISIWLSEPPGLKDAVPIAHALLPLVDDYGGKEQLEQMLLVIVKAPTGDPLAFRDLVHRAQTQTQDRVAREFVELLISGLHSN